MDMAASVAPTDVYAVTSSEAAASREGVGGEAAAATAEGACSVDAACRSDGGDFDVEAAVAHSDASEPHKPPAAAAAPTLWDDSDEAEAWWAGLNKGDASNVFTCVIFAIGAILRAVAPGTAADLILAFGLFGFAGGITNWLAVKMLFDKIPGLIGSGVIPRRFQDILGALKTMILETFFEERFLRAYIAERSAGFFEGLDLKGKLEKAMKAEGFDGALARKLEALSETPEGMMLATLAPMFGGFDTMVPMIKPMLVGVGAELIGTLSSNFDVDDVLDIKAVRGEIDKVLTQRMTTLTPEKVKRMMSNVIRDHLGWLVVWGNVFGGIIGVASFLAKY
ncbi:hypothetical protein M885DRAFT_203384 [Pelagophyceae sp. CCMP2097]|nr:hypothetical protein M885DRAFT_203384 [Pelagophyceae sp. CCMP2097]